MSEVQEIPGGWHLPEVAKAQYDLTKGELEAFSKGRAFSFFMTALSHVPWIKGWKMLDVGCGSGHYGQFVKKWIPGLSYYGTDISGAMLRWASMRVRSDHLGQATIEATAKHVQDLGISLVLTSQTIECTEDPQSLLANFLSSVPDQWVILHKLRFTAAGGKINEGTYCGHAAQLHMWSLTDLMELVMDTGRDLVHAVLWGTEPIQTWVVKPETWGME